jgi:phage minor structural protein
MVQVYADDRLVYDTRLQDTALLGLEASLLVNKAGTAEITMPPDHPAYHYFTEYRTVVTIYRDGVLLFRGRALYATDDFYRRRTITCEGERAFLLDGIMRPYMYQDGPAAIFADVIGLYNAQVEEYKRFVVGTVTATDPNNYVRLESGKAEQIADTIDKLVERVGGYIVFGTNEAGQRTINWYDTLDYRSWQVIEFGSNLLDFSRTGANTDMATVIIPYGAQVEVINEETGETTYERVDITSVNEGLDFIQDYDAVHLRGVIARPVYWDDVTVPANLLAKAQQYLASSKLLITSLELSAVDLSVLDKNIDSFRVGDRVQVRSKPHGVDDLFTLMERDYDLLDPSKDKVVLGKDLSSLTGADAAGDKKSANELDKVEHSIRQEYQLNVATAIKSATTTLSTLIQQTSESILHEVSETYAVGEDVEKMVSTSFEQLGESFTFTFTELTKVVDENAATGDARYEEIKSWIRMEDGDIILGENGNNLVLRLQNDRISFLDQGAEVAYISDKQLFITDGNFLNSLQVGNFKWLPRENGNLSLVKVGD